MQKVIHASFFFLKPHIHFLSLLPINLLPMSAGSTIFYTRMSIKQNTVHAFSSTKKYLHKIVLVLCTCQWTLYVYKKGKS